MPVPDALPDEVPEIGSGEELLRHFHRALSGVEPVPTVLFSGGLDSSMVAFCLGHLGHEPRLIAVGTPGARDLESAASAGRLLGRAVETVELDPKALGAPAVGETSTEGAPHRRDPIRVAFAWATASAPPGAVVCGQGADELFGGYAHFGQLEAIQAEERRRLDLHRLLHTEWPWAWQTAARHGRRLRSPYLDWEFVHAALRIPTAEWYRPRERKHWLRSWAIAHGLPEELAHRPKRALQYGSGVERALRPRSDRF